MYCDVVIKWVNITTLIISIDKRYTLYLDVALKWLNVVIITVNIGNYHITIIIKVTHCKQLTINKSQRTQLQD